MYYSTELFIKKGAMGKIWLFGTLGIEKARKKFKAREISQASISECCDQVKKPPIPLAFATQSILMYGTVAIYHYQITLDLKDANDSYLTLLRFIRRIQKETNIDLPPQQIHADLAEITLQERPIDLAQLDQIHDIDLREPTIIERIPSGIAMAEDLHVPEEAITMQPTEKPVAAVDRTLIDLEFPDITDVPIELDLDLDETEEQKELRELSIESAAALPLPEPAAAIPSAFELRELSHSLEPIIPEISGIPEQPSILPEVPIVAEPERISVGRRSVPPSEATPSIAELPPVPPLERKVEEVEEEEEPTQPRRPRRRAPPAGAPRRRRRRRFERTEVIEMSDTEQIVHLDEAEAVSEFVVERPLFTHIEERPLETGEFEQLFTTSLTGLYRDNEMEDAFREFANMVLNPRLQQQRLRRDAEEAGELMEVPEVPLVGPEVPAIPELPQAEISMPEIPYAGPPSVVASIPSTVPSSDMFAGYKIPSSIASPPPIVAEPLPAALRADLGELTVSEEELEFDEERQRRREERRRRRMKVTSSEEASVPPIVSRLTGLFKDILDTEMRKLESEGVEEEAMRVNLEEMLAFHAAQNDATISKRDMALGFMQVLILKNEDIIHAQQDEFHGDIYLTKGPRFDQPLPP